MDYRELKSSCGEAVSMDEEIGRIKKNETTEIVVRRTEFRGSVGIDVREYVKTDRYTGWSKNGVRIPLDQWASFRSIVDKVKVEEVGNGAEE